MKEMVSNMKCGGPADMRTYDRTWEEIENMLSRAEMVKNDWHCRYELSKTADDRAGMKDAARNYKALQGVEKTLRWVLGEKGISTPLD
jgi:hypothetical protein